MALTTIGSARRNQFLSARKRRELNDNSLGFFIAAKLDRDLIADSPAANDLSHAPHVGDGHAIDGRHHVSHP